MRRRIALITTIWKRPHLTEFFLRYWDDVSEYLASESYIDLDLYAALSPEDEHYDSHRECLDGLSWEYVDAPNTNLWEKWNAVCHSVYVSPRPCNGVVIFGSDDIATPSFIEVLDVTLRSGADYIQPNGCIMFHPDSGGMSFLNGFAGGAGRAVSAELFYKLEGKLWVNNEDYVTVDMWQDKYIQAHSARVSLRSLANDGHKERVEYVGLD
jgi:hypothetical protein